MESQVELEEKCKVILIVDDVELSQEILRLSYEECKVIDAVDSAHALAVLESKHVDLLMVDIMTDYEKRV